MTLTADQIGGAVRSVPEAVARLEAIGEMLDEADGLRQFNDLYLDVTRLIGLRLSDGPTPEFFLDKPFLADLDAAFANRYFEAVGNWMGGGPVSKPWRAMFERRYRRGLHRLQFAAAGVNVHINFDLAEALVVTWRAHPRRKGDNQRHDYNKINGVFAELYRPLRERLAAEIGPIDRGPVRKALDQSSAFLVTRTRGVAWDAAKLLAGADGPKWTGPYRAAAQREIMNRAVTLNTSVLLQPLG
jgi:hypothetical protein